LIRPLTLYVLNEALAQCHQWQEQGLTLNIAVNLSARNLLDPSSLDDVAQLLDTWQVDPSLLPSWRLPRTRSWSIRPRRSRC